MSKNLPSHTAAAFTRHLSLLAAAALLATLGACGKVTEIATEKATEKLIEAQINKDGSNAKVDLSKGGMTTEGTDENGKAFKMEFGSAQLSEADVKVPFYPGSKPATQGGTRIKKDDGEMVSLELQSADAAKTVSAWYRDKLKTSGDGKTVIDSASGDDGMSLMISDPKSNESTTVSVAPDSDGGSRITLIHATSSKPQQ